MTTKTNLATPTFNSTNWNTPLNANFTTLNNALGGTVSVSVASGDVYLTSTQAQNLIISVSGTMSANRSVLIPTGTTGSWIVSNFTTGNYLLYISLLTGGNPVIVQQYTSAIVASDGTNLFFADDHSSSASGTVIQFAGASPPFGYLICDGAQLSRSAFPRLFSAIGTTWGAGNGSTTFNIPDLRGYFLRGSGVNSDGTSAGGPVGSKQGDAFGFHTHTAYQDPHQHNVSNAWNTNSGGGSVYVGSGLNNTGTPPITDSRQPPIYVNGTGGTETRPKNIVILYCIKY